MKGRTDREARREGRGALIRCCCVIGNPLFCLPTKQLSVQSAFPLRKHNSKYKRSIWYCFQATGHPGSRRSPVKDGGKRGPWRSLWADRSCEPHLVRHTA